MSEGQRVIKYISIAFAIFLAVNIITGIIYAVLAGFSIFGFFSDFVSEGSGAISINSNNRYTFSETYENVENLTIECSVSRLVIKEGTELKVEAKNVDSNFSSKISGSTLKVREENRFLWFNSGDITSEIIVYIPSNMNFGTVKISTGAGEVLISDIIMDRLKLDLGAGNVEISNIVVDEDTNINGGVGRVAIKDSVLTRLDLNAGVGNIEVSAEILGNTDINAGVGKLELNILGNKDEYRIKAKKGIGTFTIEGTSVSDNTTYGDGDNKINIDAGLGEVRVQFENI